METCRATPRIWNTDWLVLTPLARHLRDQVGKHVAPGSVIVDLGCGDMPYAPMMRELGLDYRGADIGEGAELSIDDHGRVSLPDQAADAVISVQVLEHVADLDAYLAEVRRLLPRDGQLFLSTHGSWLYHPHPEDHRRWTRTGLILDLEKRGLRVEHVVPIVGPLATTTLIRLTGFVFGLRKLPLLGEAFAVLLSIVMNVRAAFEDAVTPAHIRRDNACVYLVRARVSA